MKKLFGCMVSVASLALVVACGSDSKKDNPQTNTPTTENPAGNPTTPGVTDENKPGTTTTTCTPSCAGKCCGNDGCGAICGSPCGQGLVCDPASCGCVAPLCEETKTQCADNLVQTCTGNRWVSGVDCAASGKTCQNGACAYPTHRGANQACKCEGDAECSVPCPLDDGAASICLILDDEGNGFCSFPCATHSECEGDFAGGCCLAAENPDDSRLCLPEEYSAACGCKNGQIRCDGSKAQTCANEQWVDGSDCSAAGQICYQGECLQSSGALCPAGQTCAEIVDGVNGCLADDQIPEDAASGCMDDPNGCAGNGNCFGLGNGDSVCIEACGVCRGGTVCTDLFEGRMGCLDETGGLAADTVAQCHVEGNTCPANSTCYIIEMDGDEISQSVCIQSCSAVH